MKYKFTQVFLQLGMILINLIYSVVLLIFWIFLFFGMFFWKKESFNKNESFFFNRIPKMPDIDEKLK